MAKDMDGTEVVKLTPGNDGNNWDLFSGSVSIDEKVVVGSTGGYIRVFSRDGMYERTIRCDDCYEFGERVVTHGNLTVTSGIQNSISKLFIYSTEDGQLLKSFEQEYSISDVAMSEQFIVSTAGDGKTFIYNNTSTDFMEIAEINQAGLKVAVSGERLVIGNVHANNQEGAAYLYKTDGTLVKTLDRQVASSISDFGESVAIIDDKVIVSAPLDDDQGEFSGSVFIYSAETGEYIEKILAPDGGAYEQFGASVCASDSYYVVGTPGDDFAIGAAYLFQSP